MKILIADDHHLILEGVKSKLCELGDDLEFATAMTIDEVRAQLAQGMPPDLLIMDLSMPGASGLDHVVEVRERFPSLPLVMLSGAEDARQMKDLLALGVRGYIPKAYSPDIMLSAIRLVISGGVYVPPMLLDPEPVKPAGQTAADPHAEGSLEGLRSLLTERQVDVLRLLALGKPNKSIARDLSISEGTVKIHLAAIFRALNVRNRVEAVVASRRLSGL
ncbi:LuxR C-terminal-related transcriptional regulator [Pseudoxanthomonas suwonensis]|uniref:LuxR family transcriptional regulator n=1 Tax=Pseudoxanthomonas suwonensis TaxID=314722 RepID=A0A0E3YZA6_9GAMM|nr:response regulator transcription factor [Pseudoxanthomonas suwonensis]AKC85907.1 LuxR family transcriptional regulator [Pseudoxanthomonas suwonensis]